MNAPEISWIQAAVYSIPWAMIAVAIIGSKVMERRRQRRLEGQFDRLAAMLVVSLPSFATCAGPHPEPTFAYYWVDKKTGDLLSRGLIAPLNAANAPMEAEPLCDDCYAQRAHVRALQEFENYRNELTS